VRASGWLRVLGFKFGVLFSVFGFGFGFSFSLISAPGLRAGKAGAGEGAVSFSRLKSGRLNRTEPNLTEVEWSENWARRARSRPRMSGPQM